MEVLISIIATIAIYLLCNKIKTQNNIIETLRKLHRSKDQLRDYADTTTAFDEEDYEVACVLERIRENNNG